MQKTGIVTDSHSGIGKEEARRLGIRILPMPFYFNEVCYYENLNLTREEFFQKLDSGMDVTTSQPSPDSVKKIWEAALTEYEEILYIPISSGLSGSCMTAAAMAQEEEFAGRIFVVDNGRVATPLHRSVLDAVELIGEGYPAEKIKHMLELAKDKMTIYIGVESLEHLRRGGRVNKATALVGNLLNIKPILKFDIGTLDLFKKCRGMVKTRKAMIEAMKYDLETKFKTWYDKGEVYLLAASSAAKSVTESWIQEIEEAFPDMEVMCDDLSMGVSCHIGQGGLGIGCSCRPERETE